MREILFKAQRADGKGWVEGFYYQAKQKKTTQHFIIYSSGFKEVKVIPETVCQFTGLTDKNGTNIFEGDEIQKSNGDKYIVEYNKETASFVFNYQGLKIHFTNSAQFTVTGNIHDK